LFRGGFHDSREPRVREREGILRPVDDVDHQDAR